MLLHDLRYTIRVLRRNRGLTLGIVLCLALGIGATSAIFSVFHAALLKPLPFADADQLVMLYDTQRSADGALREYRVSPANFDAWRRQSEAFEALTAMALRDLTLTGEGEPVYLRGAMVMANGFSTLGVQPILGRNFSSDEDRVGEAAPVAIISHGFWQRSFAGDPSAVGKSLILDGRSVTIIGVMPPGFGFPEGLEELEPRDLWIPLGLDPERLPERNWHDHFVIGRLPSELPLEQAQSHMDTIANRLAQEYPETNTGFGVRVMPLRQALVGNEIESALFLLLMAVGFLLLIACINVASMLLARATTRGSEVALRIALGAGRGRLLRFVLTESVLLALVGGAAGLLLARFTVSPLVALSGLAVPAFKHITMDLSVVSFTLIVTLATGILFGLAPALKLLDTDLREVLLEGTARTGGGRWNRRFQAGLVVGQIALVLVLLVGAGLMIRSFRQLLQIEPGFDTANLLAVHFPFPPAQYPEQGQKVALTERILDRVRALPGIESSTVTFVLPIGDIEAGAIFTVRGRAPAHPGEMLIVNNRMVGPDFFETLNIPIIEGRPLIATDHHADAPGVVVVSRHMAKQYWPDQSPLGRQLKRGGPNADTPWLTIVGVAEDVRDSRLDAEIGSTWYLPYSQHQTPWMRLVVRTAAQPMSLFPAVRQAIWSISSDQPISAVATVAEMVSGSVVRERFNSILLSLFAGLGLILATLGIYGVMSYSVNQRTVEIGIRMSLGARAHEIRRMILRQGAMLTAFGLAIGLVLSFIIHRFFASLFFGIGSTDPLTVTAMAAFLIAVTLLATYLPARRATRVDPAVVVKSM